MSVSLPSSLHSECWRSVIRGTQALPCSSHFSRRVFSLRNVSCNTLIVGAVYGQTKVKNMAWSRLKEEVELTRQVCKKDHNSASYNADPWMWTLFLYFSFPLVPVFPRCVLRTSVWRAAQHWKGSTGKYAGNHSYSNPSWRFLHDPTEKSRTKETCLSW